MARRSIDSLGLAASVPLVKHQTRRYPAQVQLVHGCRCWQSLFTASLLTSAAPRPIREVQWPVPGDCSDAPGSRRYHIRAPHAVDPVSGRSMYEELRIQGPFPVFMACPFCHSKLVHDIPPPKANHNMSFNILHINIGCWTRHSPDIECRVQAGAHPLNPFRRCCTMYPYILNALGICQPRHIQATIRPDIN